jgi:hypothetical protein
MTMTRRAAVGLVAMLATFRGKRSAGGVSRVVDGQPRPRITHVNHLWAGHRIVTAIARRWDEGDAAACRLCPGKCAANEDVCLIQVDDRIDLKDAAMFSAKNPRHQEGRFSTPPELSGPIPTSTSLQSNRSAPNRSTSDRS